MISRQNTRPGLLFTFGLASLFVGACSADNHNDGVTNNALSTGSSSTGGTSAGAGSSVGNGASGNGTLGNGAFGNGTVGNGTAVNGTGSNSGGGLGANTSTGGTTTSGATGAVGADNTNSQGGTSVGGATAMAGDIGGASGGSSANTGNTGGIASDGTNAGAGNSGGAASGEGGSSPGGENGGMSSMNPESGGAGGESGGDMSSGTCEKGQIMASEVVIMGESFYAIDPQYIQNRIQDNARAAGSLGANESYRNVAVSGQNMDYIANNEWTAATQGGASIKLVIMDGGGIDCLTGTSCPSCPTTFQGLLDKMASAGVEDVIYTRYPEPGNPPGSNASLKSCLDAMQPDMQTVCEGSTSPTCHWVDLRPVWVNGDTSDGLHPTQSGGEHVGDLLWQTMVDLCLAQ